jgi:hypothetical protein
MLCLMFAEDYTGTGNCQSLKKNYFVFYQKYTGGCQNKYPAGYPVTCPYRTSGIRLLDELDIRPVGRITGKNSIRCIPSKKLLEKLQKWRAIWCVSTM